MSGSASAESVARFRDVTKRFDTVTALRDFDLDLEPGRVTALLGPNGAGKTTAVRMLLGLTAPSSGRVTVFGGDPRAASTRTRIGAMLQVAKVPETLRVREHIDLFRSYYPSPMPYAEVVEASGLQGLDGTAFGRLSGGQKQRLLFALALCGNASLIVLDEPTVGLDVEARRVLWDRIRRLSAAGRAVLLTTHYLDEADALAHRIVVIARGEIVADGSPAEVKARVAGRRIRCVTSLALDVVQAIPGVGSVRQAGERTEILAAIAEPVVRELLLGDPALSELEVGGAGLEEAFLSLTREKVEV
ncbi:MAG: ABC transporter ATP-binding protein [Gemmatimonadota bacterium]|nr:ABC transporter ATP-binding protein [Gemmatimonadota bacterium]